MANRQHRLISLACASGVLERMGANHACSVTALRVLCVLCEVDTTLYRVRKVDLIAMLACHEDTMLAGVNECLANKWISRTYRRHAYYAPTTAGEAIAASVGRAENTARTNVVDMELKAAPTVRRKRKPITW